MSSVSILSLFPQMETDRFPPSYTVYSLGMSERFRFSHKANQNFEMSGRQMCSMFFQVEEERGELNSQQNLVLLCSSEYRSHKLQF